MSEVAPPRLPSSRRVDGVGAPAGYRQRVLSALKWNASGELAAQAIRFAFGIALARLLSPHEFGLMAMLTIVVQFVIGNADCGFEDALVQMRDSGAVHQSSVFWTLLAVGPALTACQIAAAPWLARFYGVDELSRLAIGLSAVYSLRILGTVPRAILSRQLDFRVIASRWCVAVCISGSCALALAWCGFGVVSLVVDLLVSTAAESVLLWHASGWRPRFEFRLQALRELAGFSAYRPASRALSYWAQRIDQLLIGRLLGSNALGVYARAFSVARAPVAASRVIVDVMFPSLALIQEDDVRVRSVYLRTTAAVTFASVPIAFGLFATADPLVRGVLGPQWILAIPILRILSLAGLFQSISVFATGLYLALGRADLVLRLTVAQRLSMIAAIVFALRWGVYGVATAQLLSAACTAVPTLYFAGRLIHLPLRTVVAQISRVFVAGLLMAALVLAVDRGATGQLAALERLGIESVTGVVAYWTALWLLRVQVYRELLSLVPDLLGLRKSARPN